MARIAINGFGRIGRAFFKKAWGREGFDIVAVNDLGDPKTMAYLLKYDTVYGRSALTIETDAEGFIIDGKKVRVVSEKDPAKLPWKELGVDLVVESSGFFTAYGKAEAHIGAGAKRVVITAPAKNDPPAQAATAMVLMGINDAAINDAVLTSNASCTTNAAAPVMQILKETIGIKKAMLSTVHGYTGTQALVDGPSKKDLREGRAAAQNIVPSTTGAATAVGEIITDLKGKFDGISFRVPVPAGSVVDLTLVSARPTSVEEVNTILKNAAKEPRWQKMFSVTEEPLVSTDILATPYASIADLAFTKVVDGDLVKVLAWYDNEEGYTHALVEHVAAAIQHL